MPDRNDDGTLENFVYRQLNPLRPAIEYWSEVFDLDMVLVASILVVERQQYHLPEAMRAVRRMGHSVLDLMHMVGGCVGEDTTKRAWRGLMAWVNCSRGFCRIKFDTATEAWNRHRQRHSRPLLSEMDICNHETNPFLSVAVSCVILDELAHQWFFAVRCIRKQPAIMATLYNISDFNNKQPHPYPQSGGSVMETIIDGVDFEGVPFGDRVAAVMKSENMKKWMAEK